MRYAWLALVVVGCKHEPMIEIGFEPDEVAGAHARAQEIAGAARAKLLGDHIAGEVIAEGKGRVVVAVADPTHSAEVSSWFATTYREAEPRRCHGDDPVNALCFEVTMTAARALCASTLTRAIDIVRARVSEKGDNTKVAVRDGVLVVAMPASTPAAIIAETSALVTRNVTLEMKVVDDNSTYMQHLFAKVGDDRSGSATDPDAIAAGVRADVDAWHSEDGGPQHTDYFLRASDRDGVSGREVIERYVIALAVKDRFYALPTDRELGYEHVTPPNDATDRTSYWRTYYLEREAAITGSAIANATGSLDRYTEKPLVLLDFTPEGKQRFAELTMRIRGKKLATLLDGQVRSVPIINTPITGGKASIMMGGGDVAHQERDRDDLVEILRAGSLPCPLRELGRLQR